MLPAAAAQAVALAGLLLAVGPLAAASWPLRAPAAALLLWQAVGLAGGLLALEVGVTVALSPVGSSYPSALGALPAPLPWWAWAAALGSALLLLRLVTVLTSSVVATLRARHRHRVLVDLVATAHPLLRGTSVVDSALPVAYCLPGLRPRVVVTRGALTALGEDEVRAVLEHELAHVAGRHDLVVLPFVALGATFPRLPAVRRARTAVALLVEVLADDRAVRRHDRRVLASALCKVSSASSPRGSLGAGSQVLVRAGRLLDPPPPLPLSQVLAVLGLAALVAALPVAGLLLPHL